jgi:hypothetical protein
MLNITGVLIAILTALITIFLLLLSVRLRFKGRILVKMLELDGTVTQKWCKKRGNEVILRKKKRGRPGGAPYKVKNVSSLPFKVLNLFSARYIMIYRGAKNTIRFNPEKKETNLNYPSIDDIKDHFDNEVMESASNVNVKREIGFIDFILIGLMAFSVILNFL